MSSVFDAAALSGTSAKSRRRRRQWDYQRELVERTRLARAAPDQHARRLAIQVADQGLLIDLTQSEQILSVSTLVTVPLTKPWFLGLTSHRGKLIGVVDLAGFIGKPIAAADSADRLIIFAASLSSHCALRVARVWGLTDISAMQCQPALADAPLWSGQSYRDAGSAVWTEINLAALVRDPAFLDIAA